MSEEKQFAMSMYANKESLYKAKSEYYLNITDKLLIKNAAQAQEIDELKAYVDRVREAIHKYQSTGLGAEWALVLSTLETTPAQNPSAHDATIEEEVIERCAERCDFSVECRCSDAIRDMSRIYNVR